MKSENVLKFGALAIVILMAGLCQVAPHPYGFSPITALALFGAAYYTRREFIYIVPLATMWASDLYLNHAILWTNYVAILLIAFLGTLLLKKITLMKLFGVTVLSSVVFFLITNLGIGFYANAGNFPTTLKGLLPCYIANLTSLRNILLGNYFFVFLSFGFYELFGKQLLHYLRILLISEKY